jgi:hypothetical protein
MQLNARTFSAGAQILMAAAAAAVASGIIKVDPSVLAILIAIQNAFGGTKDAVISQNGAK